MKKNLFKIFIVLIFLLSSLSLLADKVGITRLSNFHFSKIIPGSGKRILERGLCVYRDNVRNHEYYITARVNEDLQKQFSLTNHHKVKLPIVLQWKEANGLYQTLENGISKKFTGASNIPNCTLHPNAYLRVIIKGKATWKALSGNYRNIVHLTVFVK